MIRAVIFDFDGVIVDSNRLKQDAFLEVCPKESEAFVKKVLGTMRGSTRFEVFREVGVGLGVVAVEDFVQRKASEFNQLVQEGMQKGALIPEAPAILERASKRYPLYINSATPELPLHETMAALKIEKFFKEILGAPATKEENLKKILAHGGLKGKEVAFVGDGEADCRAALGHNCFFIGVANEFNQWTDTTFPLISNITEIGKYLLM